MKLFILTLIVLSFLPVQDQQGYPTPPNAAGRLFYIQHSNNHNTYVYDANLTGKNFNIDNPVNVYCIAYAKDGEKKELTTVQRKMAYGVNIVKAAHRDCEFTLSAYPEKKLYLRQYRSGTPYVALVINGKSMVLKKMFLECNAMGTNVKSIDFYGKDIATGKESSERMYIK